MVKKQQEEKFKLATDDYFWQSEKTKIFILFLHNFDITSRYVLLYYLTL